MWEQNGKLGINDVNLRKMMMDGKEMIKPLLLKLGVALALSFAGGYLYRNRIRILRTRLLHRLSRGDKGISSRRSRLKGDFCETQSTVTEVGNDLGAADTTSSPNGTNPRDNECLCLPEMESTKSERADEETAEMEQQILSLRNMVQVLQERERNLEMEMLNCHSFKEQEAIIQELHNHLKINTMEAKFSSLKIESLKVENQTLKAQASEYNRVVAELGITKAKIRLLKRKMKSDAEQANQQLLDLQQKVMMLEEQEHEAALNEPETQEKLQQVKDLEDELSKLGMENSRLQNENTELEKKLESTQVLTSVLQCPQDKVLEEAKQLRQVNSNLEQELDRLRMDHCSDVEELVYLKWVNACLRYELRNCKTPFGNTAATNLNKAQSPRSEEKVKTRLLEYANSGINQTSIDSADFESDSCSSSQASSLTETSESDNPASHRSPDKRISHPNKEKIIKKLKKIFSAKHHHDHKRVSPLGRASKSSPVSRRASFSVASLDDISSDSISSCASVEHTALFPNTPYDSRNAATHRKETQVKNSENASRLSLDIHSLANVSVEDIKDMISDERRASDVGSTYSSKTSASRDSYTTDFSRRDHEYDKLELTKIAEVLNRTHEKTKRRT